MKICLCSAFRDSVTNDHLDRYLEQVTGLHLALAKRGDNLRCVWGEGDSTDDTLGRLTWAYTYARWAITIVDCTHGGPRFGSVVNAQRFRQLAHVGKRIFAAIPADADVVVWVESDLTWEPATLLTLIERVASGGYAVMAPMVFLRRDGWGERDWYDTWATRKDGKHFSHKPPYHPCYTPDRPFVVDSTGSCVAFRGDIARKLIIDERLFPGMCEQICQMGHSVWIDPSLSVVHE